jgi:hypothetical protein
VADDVRGSPSRLIERIIYGKPIRQFFIANYRETIPKNQHRLEQHEPRLASHQTSYSSRTKGESQTEEDRKKFQVNKQTSKDTFAELNVRKKSHLAEERRQKICSHKE